MLAEIITFAGIVCAGVLTEGAAGSGLGGCTDHSDSPLSSRARSAPLLSQRLGFLAERTHICDPFSPPSPQMPGHKHFTCPCGAGDMERMVPGRQPCQPRRGVGTGVKSEGL